MSRRVKNVLCLHLLKQMYVCKGCLAALKTIPDIAINVYAQLFS